MKEPGKRNIEIGQVRLTLPSGYEHRAQGLARRVVDRLSTYLWNRPIQVERLAVPPIQAIPGESEAALAVRIADAVYRQLR
ncbi:hypothetical protein ACTRW9_02315 [Nitrospina sp. 32_T5]|uniref:hypothetical protein n=1 Tax=unclassified Nitrospina TaxID=2638683 RepID=UPI003F9960F7